jgi:hypothetical protein
VDNCESSRRIAEQTELALAVSSFAAKSPMMLANGISFFSHTRGFPNRYESSPVWNASIFEDEGLMVGRDWLCWG